MSIIQTIRDKGAKISVALIALALIGFILTDYFSGRGRGLFGSEGSSTVGVVNGKTISYDELKKKADQIENNYKQQGYPSSPAMTQEALNQSWNQEVNRLLMRSELKKIGMRIGKKERGDLLYGPNGPDFIKKAGTDEKGAYDPVRAKQQVDQMLKDRRTPQTQKDEFKNYVAELDEYRMQEKYNALFANSTNFPRWYVEKLNNDNSQIANISLAKMLYTDSTLGPDSLIKITDKEIEDYIKTRKDQYQQEKTRSVSYVTFSAAATAIDSAAARKRLLDIKPEFDTVTDVAGFLARNGNPEPPDRFFSPAQLPPAGKDSVMKMSRNAVFGPYLEGNSYVLLKLLEIKSLPDSAKVRHILIKTYDPQTNQPILDDSTAKKRIDSIEMAIKGGARFDSLAIKYSDDKGSGAKGGLLTVGNSDYFSSGQMVKEFDEFSFQGTKGQSKVVKTVFGYHLMEILDQKNFQNNYRVGFLSEEIRPSQQTDNDAIQSANEFFGEAKDLKSFDAAYVKARNKGAIKAVATDITPMAAQFGGGMGGGGITSRSLVMNIFKAKLGEVLKPEKAGENYVVAIVTEINNEGLQSVARARPAVESILRNKKKAEMIMKKIGTVTTLEDAASKLGTAIIRVDSLRMDINSFNQQLGMEPRVKGASFNPNNKGKVVGPIEGNSGVYMIRVESVSATPSTGGSVEDQRLAKYSEGKNRQAGPLAGLKKAATIKDKRADKF